MSTQNDQRVVLAVVILLGLTVLAVTGGLIYLASSHSHPEGVVLTALGGLGTTALGALAALLVSSHTGTTDAPQSVTVDQPADQPIPTTDATTGNLPSVVDIHPDAPATSDL